MPHPHQFASTSIRAVVMVLSVVFLVVFFAVVHVNNCSTIITRGMIRTQTQPSSKPQGQTSHTLPDPEKLTLTGGDVHKKYLRIFPTVAEEGRTEFKRVLEDQDVMKNHTVSEEIHETDAATKQVGPNVDSVTTWKSNADVDLENGTRSENILNDSSPEIQLGTSTPPSPHAISNLYWGRYNNLSSEYFESSYRQNLDAASAAKGLGDDSFWEIVQRFYTCTWSVGLMPCLQDTLRVVSSETSVLQLLSPRLPKLELGEGQVNEIVNGGEADEKDTDQYEGRKRTKRLRVFQTLQFLLPLLLAIKMSMLPALAVMVLVTGKAFFMSLLSLGAAIFSFFLQAPGLAADKRHEIAPQMPAPHGQDPSKYYYVM